MFVLITLMMTELIINAKLVDLNVILVQEDLSNVRVVRQVVAELQLAIVQLDIIQQMEITTVINVLINVQNAKLPLIIALNVLQILIKMLILHFAHVKMVTL